MWTIRSEANTRPLNVRLRSSGVGEKHDSHDFPTMGITCKHAANGAAEKEFSRIVNGKCCLPLRAFQINPANCTVFSISSKCSVHFLNWTGTFTIHVNSGGQECNVVIIPPSQRCGWKLSVALGLKIFSWPSFTKATIMLGCGSIFQHIQH